MRREWAFHFSLPPVSLLGHSSVFRKGLGVFSCTLPSGRSEPVRKRIKSNIPPWVWVGDAASLAGTVCSAARPLLAVELQSRDALGTVLAPTEHRPRAGLRRCPFVVSTVPLYLPLITMFPVPSLASRMFTRVQTRHLLSRSSGNGNSCVTALCPCLLDYRSVFLLLREGVALGRHVTECVLRGNVGYCHLNFFFFFLNHCQACH